MTTSTASAKSTTPSTDRIEKEIVLRAPRARVWRALTDPTEFGAWFGVKLEGSFSRGQPVKGKMTVKGYEGREFEMVVDEVAPEERFSYRWHPYAVDLTVDYSTEPMTLVAFRLEELGDGTKLTVVESGFDGVPAARRAEAMRMNTHGWGIQLENIARHVAAA
jgi:uncharacterized protein YndB with AHSA1/START domain